MPAHTSIQYEMSSSIQSELRKCLKKLYSTSSTTSTIIEGISLNNILYIVNLFLVNRITMFFNIVSTSLIHSNVI